MTLKIKLPPPPPPPPPPPQESIALKITKTLDGNLLIADHQYMDIVVLPASNRVLCMPKEVVEKDVYEYQKAFMNSLFQGGITNARIPQGGLQFGVMETTYPAESDQADNYVSREYDQHIEDRFVDPTEQDSTAYGEIPPYQDTPAGQQDNVPYTYAGYGYYF